MTPANSGPIPFKLFNIAPGAGMLVRRAEHSIPLSLHGLDLLKRKFESIKFASNLCLQMLWQRTTIAGLEFGKPRASFAQ